MRRISARPFCDLDIRHGLEKDRFALGMANDEVLDIRNGCLADLHRPDPDVDLPVAFGEPRGHLALDFVADGGGYVTQVEPQPHELVPVERHLKLRVPQLRRGADIRQTRDPRHHFFHLGGSSMDLLQVVAVDLHLHRCPEREDRGPLELETSRLRLLEPLSEPRYHLLLVLWSRPTRHLDLNPGYVFSLGSGFGQGQPCGPGHRGIRCDARVPVQHLLDVLDKAIGDFQRRSLRKLHPEAELPLGEGGDQIEPQAGDQEPGPRECQERRRDNHASALERPRQKKRVTPGHCTHQPIKRHGQRPGEKGKKASQVAQNETDKSQDRRRHCAKHEPYGAADPPH